MPRYFLMPKNQKDLWLPKLFDLYYENMHSIAPSGLTYEQEHTQWFSAVSPALDKAPRNVLLCADEDRLLGYIQFYTRGELLMIEEVQIVRLYQSTLLFPTLCRRLAGIIPENIQTIEAYADKRNIHSRKIMKKLGMSPVSDSGESPFVHLRGDAQSIRKRFLP